MTTTAANIKTGQTFTHKGETFTAISNKASNLLNVAGQNLRYILVTDDMGIMLNPNMTVEVN